MKNITIKWFCGWGIPNIFTIGIMCLEFNEMYHFYVIMIEVF